MTRNVSECGVYVECLSAVSLPLYRLVQFQLERDVRDSSDVPGVLRQGRLLSAVYRIIPPTAKNPQGFALRLIVDPKRRSGDVTPDSPDEPVTMEGCSTERGVASEPDPPGARS